MFYRHSVGSYEKSCRGMSFVSDHFLMPQKLKYRVKNAKEARYWSFAFLFRRFFRFIHDFRRLFPKIGHIVSCASLIFRRGYCFVWFCFLFLFCFLLLFQITPCTILPISWHFVTRSAYTVLTLCYLFFSDAKNFYVFVIGLIRQGDPIFQFKISV